MEHVLSSPGARFVGLWCYLALLQCPNLQRIIGISRIHQWHMLKLDSGAIWAARNMLVIAIWTFCNLLVIAFWVRKTSLTWEFNLLTHFLMNSLWNYRRTESGAPESAAARVPPLPTCPPAHTPEFCISWSEVENLLMNWSAPPARKSPNKH